LQKQRYKFNWILIYLRADLTTERPVTELARVRGKTER
jgi:hypothetical protein